MTIEEKQDYRDKLRKTIDIHMEEAGVPFILPLDSYEYMSAIDSMSLALDEKGALRFAISYTRQGEQGDPYLDVSYYSAAIQKQISFGEMPSNIATVNEFIDFALETREEMDELEHKLSQLA